MKDDPMNKFYLTLFALLLPLAVWAEAKKPNVVLIMSDDMGWMDSTPYGSKYYETPNMDRLSKQSMRFTDAYAHPLCSPTRASILSGQYPSRHGITTASGHQRALRQPEELRALRREPSGGLSRGHKLRQHVADPRVDGGHLVQIEHA